MAKKTFEAKDGKMVEVKPEAVAHVGSPTPAEEVSSGTRVFLKLTASGQAAANYAAKELHVSFMALLINAGLLFDREEVTAEGKSDDGKPVIEAGAELVNRLVAMAIAFRDSHPITVLAAGGIISGAERELLFHSEKNPKADFSGVVARIAAAREALKAVAFSKDAVDCREIVNGLGDVVAECQRITLENKATHNRDLASSIGMTAQVEEQIVAALALSTFREKVNALGVTTATLYNLGAKTSETVAREAEREQRGSRRNPAQPTTERGFSKPAWDKRRQQQGWRG